MLILLISTQKFYFNDDDAVHVLNNQSFRHTQPFSFLDLDKSIGPIFHLNGSLNGALLAKSFLFITFIYKKQSFYIQIRH